ncbi:hypothetical protein C8Q80DRAFT_1189738 [Daedaleopsis nitida]|nr:hypothetical protein C8Q80DRAFT_1189738 [Daedaleopsis nitida]
MLIPQPALSLLVRQATTVTSSTSSTSSVPGSSASNDAPSTNPLTFTATGTPTTPSANGAGTSITTTASITSDSPFFPSPTGETVNHQENVEFTKNAVEGALIIAATALIIALTLWRIVKLRRHDRPLGHFFRSESQPDGVPARPRAVPRTTGLPSVPPPPSSYICDLLPTTVLHGERRRGRGRRAHADDIDVGGRRGNIQHPDDPNEYLPEYDDKDMLPRYQDLESSSATPRPGAHVNGRSPNGERAMSDTIPLVTRLQLPSSVTLEEGNAATSDSHEVADPNTEQRQRSG